MVAPLRADHIRVTFDGLIALDEVDLWLNEGEILGLIGPNGAGKTTLLNVISGYLRPESGSVRIAGLDVTRWPPPKTALSVSLCRTFQGLRNFGAMTVLENVEAAIAGRVRKRERVREQATQLLEEMGLLPVSDRVAQELPNGDAHRLAVARAVATNPTFLLLDEPAAGLNEHETRDLSARIRGFSRRRKCAVLIVDHDMDFVMGLCQRVHVLDHGRTISIGTPDEVRKDSLVVSAYLGPGT